MNKYYFIIFFTILALAFGTLSFIKREARDFRDIQTALDKRLDESNESARPVPTVYSTKPVQRSFRTVTAYWGASGGTFYNYAEPNDWIQVCKENFSRLEKSEVEELYNNGNGLTLNDDNRNMLNDVVERLKTRESCVDVQITGASNGDWLVMSKEDFESLANPDVGVIEVIIK